jgi:hypothetical protein
MAADKSEPAPAGSGSERNGRHMDLKDVYEAISAALGEQVADAEVVAGEGLRLQPHPIISTEHLEVLVLPILAKIDWIVTSIKRGVLA